MCRHGHKNGRDDVYSVQYDDGDIENLQFRDVRKMLKKSPADKRVPRSTLFWTVWVLWWEVCVWRVVGGWVGGLWSGNVDMEICRGYLTA